MIHFKWLKNRQSASTVDVQVEDEKIFHLEIRQKEAGFAVAHVVVENKGQGLLKNPDRRCAAISMDNQLLFVGRLMGMPTRLDAQLMRMEFIAEPEDSAQQRQVLIESLKTKNDGAELFYSRDASLGQLLQSRTQLPYWCRITGLLKLSDIFTGSQSLHIKDKFFYDSLQTSIVQTPLKAVSIDLKAEWTQKGRGWCELSQSIKEKFPRGLISTLTPQSLEKSWWRPGQSIGQTGYRVEASTLKKLRNLGPEFKRCSTEIKPEQRDIKFERHWYDLNLSLSWFYQQKRIERTAVTLHQSVQDLAGAGLTTRKLNFSLNSIVGSNHEWRPNHRYTKGFGVLYQGKVFRCVKNHTTSTDFDPQKWRCIENAVHVDGQSLRSHFFQTERGRQTIEHALDIAKAHLAASSRAISIRFSGRLEDLARLSLDHAVTIKDPRLPDGTALGKVSSYRFVVNGETGQRIAHVNLAVAVGQASAAIPPTQVEQPCFQTQSGLRYRVEELDDPYSRLSHWTTGDMVQDVSVSWSADQQNQSIVELDATSEQHVLQTLKSKCTDIDVRLKDLNMTSCEEKNVGVDVLTTWSAPKQIDLSA